MRLFQVTILFLILISFTTNADVYKWVDEKGVTHYGNQKPPEAKAEQVKVSGGGGGNSSNSDPLDQLDPAERVLAEAMKKELLKDHGNGELDCSKAMSNTTEQVDTYVAQAKRNLNGGHINQSQYNQVETEFRKLKSKISVSRCQSASGTEKDFYLCMSNDNNSAIGCLSKTGSLFD
ncbi:MAG: DUF4124 domain-containing protein [Cellvibrio sp.]|nr:DUF4124 domain-containing protein [Cellvibrio sp.]